MSELSKERKADIRFILMETARVEKQPGRWLKMVVTPAVVSFALAG